MIIEIPGKPIALARPKFWAQGAKFGARDSQKMEKAVTRGCIIKSLIEALNSEKKDSVISASKLAVAKSFSVEMYFCFLPPQSWSKKKKNDCIGCSHHAIKPDIDNLVKFYLDCAIGIVWTDDCKICKLSAEKYYGNEAMTTLVIHPHWG